MKKTVLNKFWLGLLLAFSFTSCLKDKGYENGEYGSIRNIEGKEYITIPTANKRPNTAGLESKPGNQSLSLFAVSYDYVNPAAEDITATIAVNNAPVRAMDSTAVLLPASTYSLPSATITVKKGQRVSDLFMFTLNTSTLDPTKKYGIGFTITSVSKAGVVIASNLKDVVYVFSLKNQYDGIYTVVDGFVQRYTAPGAPEPLGGLNGPVGGNPDVTLATTGPNSLEFSTTPSGPVGLQWAKGANSGVAGIDNLRMSINTTTNEVTMSSLGNATLANWEGKENRYDPSTRTFYSNFRWNPAANRREYSVILKYKGPR